MPSSKDKFTLVQNGIRVGPNEITGVQTCRAEDYVKTEAENGEMH